MSYRQDFELVWDKFVVNLKGRMNESLKRDELNLSRANLLLKDSALCWFDQYNVVGKWPVKYSKNYPDKGALILSILQDDMVFKVEVKDTSPDNMKLILALAGAVAGGVISLLLFPSLIVRIIGIIVPGIVFYLGYDAYQKASRDKICKKIIDGYVEQLSKYKTSIVNVIEN